MITTGIFPDSFKKSKIIPIFKKGDQSLLINYRPILLLPTFIMVGLYQTLMKLQIHSTCILLISELILPLKLKHNWIIILLTFHNTWTRRHLHNLNLNVLHRLKH